MTYDDIAEDLMKRRSELVDMLEKNAKLEIEKQHQIYGAINEIDIFLQALQYQRENLEDSESDPITLVKPIDSGADTITKMINDLRKKIKKK
jgi:hypothetical protein